MTPLPCPFCGHRAPYIGGDLHREWVQCARASCEARGPERKTTANAIKSWNRAPRKVNP